MPLKQLKLEHLVFAIDLTGTALFAAEGASTGIAFHLDLLGVLVLAFCTALGGGIIRDVLLGVLPPNAMRKWVYSAVALSTGLLLFVLNTPASVANTFGVTVLDAAGLSFCAVAGATKAIEYGMHPLLGTLLGGISGVGGGTVRDMLISRVPSVLQSDVYAAAALFGAAVSITLIKLKVNPQFASLVGIGACFFLRLYAVTHHWNLPMARS